MIDVAKGGAPVGLPAPETTPAVDAPAEADGETRPGVKPDTTPGVDAPTEPAPGAAADPVPEGDTVGLAPETEPEVRTEPVSDGDPGAGVDTSDGLPTDTVPGACADPAPDGEATPGIHEPLDTDASVRDAAGVIGEPGPGEGLETSETSDEPPQGIEEKVGDQPGEFTSGSVGTAVETEAGADREAGIEETPPGVVTTPDADPVDADEVAIAGLALGAETLLGTGIVPGADPAANEDPDGVIGAPADAGPGADAEPAADRDTQGEDCTMDCDPVGAEIVAGVDVGAETLPEGGELVPDADPARDEALLAEGVTVGVIGAPADAEPETDAGLGAEAGFGADAEAPAGVEVPCVADRKGVTVGGTKLAVGLPVPGNGPEPEGDTSEGVETPNGEGTPAADGEFVPGVETGRPVGVVEPEAEFEPAPDVEPAPGAEPVAEVGPLTVMVPLPGAREPAEVGPVLGKEPPAGEDSVPGVEAPTDGDAVAAPVTVTTDIPAN